MHPLLAMLDIVRRDQTEDLPPFTVILSIGNEQGMHTQADHALPSIFNRAIGEHRDGTNAREIGNGLVSPIVRIKIHVGWRTTRLDQWGVGPHCG
jgi:hypothetical protein